MPTRLYTPAQMEKPTCMPEGDLALLADLNPEQQAAVTAPPGPLRVVAGAGTGKTRVLTRRVAWLIAQGARPWSVLAITFTNKAARVLVDRLAHLPGGSDVWAGTFHRFGAWLLRRHGEAIGIDPRFTILDREDQHRLLGALLDDATSLGARWKPPATAAWISRLKNGSAATANAAASDLGASPSTWSVLPSDATALEKIFQQYTERLRVASLLDFDDLLGESVRLLVEAPEVGDVVRARFRHVLVDEYQDTNVVQRDLLLQLVEPGGSLTVVGDPDQSIYRWRGATIANILAFDKHLGGATTVVLERNYRSTPAILACAEAVIARNVDRHAKHLVAMRPEGRPVDVVHAYDPEEEGRLLADRAARWIAAGRRPDQIAVIYRINAASRALELGLRERRIPYVVVAGTEFFQRREVKDLLAYARLVENPNDDAAFLRVVNVPKRGIGDTSLARLRSAAYERGISLFAAASGPGNPVGGRAGTGLAGFVALCAGWGKMPRSPVGDLLATIADQSGYRAALVENSDEFERARVENVDETIAFARQLEKQDPTLDLAAFLERVSLVSEQDDVDEQGGAVHLMSVHAAKGLEFPCVWVAGAENGWFPHARSVDEDGGSEEERRLFYVALTRAEDELVCSWASARATWRGFERRMPSPYLRDFPRERVQVAGPSLRPPEVDLPVVRESGSGLCVGERVRHPYFGDGLLVDMAGQGADLRVTVEFSGHGRRTLLLSHARLEKCLP